MMKELREQIDFEFDKLFKHILLEPLESSKKFEIYEMIKDSIDRIGEMIDEIEEESTN